MPTIYSAYYPELSDLLDVPIYDIPSPQKGDILEWIEQEYRKARGCGLESIGPAVLPALWQQQSKNWEDITLRYAKDIIFYVHNFICKLPNRFCPDERTRTSLFSILMDPLLERYQKAIAHVEFIVKVERIGTPLTLNHYYNDNLQKLRLGRLREAMEKLAVPCQSGDKDVGKFVKLDVIAASVPMGNIEHTILDIHRY